MKKWLDDLYAILLKRGFNTLDNVLKKYKTEIEDYEEIHFRNEVITLNSNDFVVINIPSYYNKYDRYMIFNRGKTDSKNFILGYYKFTDDLSIEYYRYAPNQNEIRAMFYDNKNLVITNLTEETIELDLYLKKVF